MFKIVEFSDQDIAIVHKAWMIDAQHVWWPPFKQSSKIYTACRKGLLPDKSSWKQYPIRLVYQNGKVLLFTFGLDLTQSNSQALALPCSDKQPMERKAA